MAAYELSLDKIKYHVDIFIIRNCHRQSLNSRKCEHRYASEEKGRHFARTTRDTLSSCIALARRERSISHWLNNFNPIVAAPTAFPRPFILLVIRAATFISTRHTGVAAMRIACTASLERISGVETLPLPFSPLAELYLSLSLSHSLTLTFFLSVLLPRTVYT